MWHQRQTRRVGIFSFHKFRSAKKGGKRHGLSPQSLKSQTALAQGASLAVAAKQAQHHEEEVDKIKVQGQRAKYGASAHGRAVLEGGVLAELAQLLRVISGQAGEDEHAKA